jgi:CcmD family protein
MTDMFYLFTAYALVWAGVLIYMIRLTSLRRQLEERIKGIEDRLEDKGSHNV